jgi:TolA-binding protein
LVTAGPANTPADGVNGRTIASIGIVLVALVLALFGRTVRYDFVNLDDDEYVLNNPAVVQGVTVSGIGWAFTHTHAANWHPLAWISHMLDCEIYRLSAGGHHLTSVVLHAINSVLLLVVLTRLTGGLWRSTMVAVLFAVHPLHVESVAWISERKDVLSTFFGLLCLLKYEQYSRQQSLGQPGPRGVRSYLLAILFFALALMSKPMMVTLPFVLLLIDWWPLGRLAIHDLRSTSGRLIREKIPFFLLSAASCAVTFVVQSRSGAAPSLARISLLPRIENAFVAYARYLFTTIWPTHLAVPYPHPGVWGREKVIVSVVIVIGLVLLVLLLARKLPVLAVGWFWFVGMLVPVIGLVQVGNQSMADRYTYLPVVGLFLAGTWIAADILERWWGRAGRVVGGTLAIVLVSACAGLSWKQVEYWRNSETLFQHTIAVTPNNAIAHYNLGSFYFSSGRTDEAIEQYRKTLEIRPSYDDALNNLGIAVALKGDTAEGERLIREAIRLRPDKADAHYNLGNVLVAQQRFDEAMASYNEALRLKPDLAEAHNNLANILVMRGEREKAVEHYREVLRVRPGHEGARRQLQALGFTPN